MSTLFGIIGAGGFGHEVMPVAREMLNLGCSCEYELVFVDEQPKSSDEYTVMSVQEFLARQGDKYYNVTISDSGARRRFAEDMERALVRPFSITAASSMQLGKNDIGEGAILCPYTIITASARIGRFFHANIYSYVAHNCLIGDFVTFAPAVHCNGNVMIGDDAYVGTGATIKQGITIGRGAVVGMGAVVTKDIPPFVTVVGNPAKRI